MARHDAARYVFAMAVLVLLLGGVQYWLSRPSFKSDAVILGEVEQIRSPQTMNVPRQDAQFIHDFMVRRGYKSALEVGTSNGYSGIWMAVALRRTGGKLVTLEIDRGRAAQAATNFKWATLDGLVDLRVADANAEIPRLAGPFDFVFLDAVKTQYVDYLRAVLPKLSSGGAIIAHNVASHQADLQPYLDAVQKHPDLKTTLEHLSEAGMAVSVKR